MTTRTKCMPGNEMLLKRYTSLIGLNITVNTTRVHTVFFCTGCTFEHANGNSTTTSTVPECYHTQELSDGRIHSRTGHESPEGEKRYSSTLSLTSGRMWSTPPLASLPPGKTRYLLHRRLGGPQGRSVRPHRESISRPSTP